MDEPGPVEGTGPLSRRRILWAAAAAPAALGLAPAAHAAERGARTLWSRRPEGSPADRGDEGVPFDVVAQHGVAPTVERGTMVAHLASRPGATYIMQRLPAVDRVGAVFGVDPGSDHGALGLIIWSSWAALTGPCHVVITPRGWTAGTVLDGALTDHGGGTFRRPLVRDGRPYRAQVRLEGRVLSLELPDGTRARTEMLTGPQGPGSTACWEFYRQRGDGAAYRLHETWAD